MAEYNNVSCGQIVPGSESLLYSVKTIYQNGKPSTNRKQ